MGETKGKLRTFSCVYVYRRFEQEGVVRGTTQEEASNVQHYTGVCVCVRACVCVCVYKL